MDNIIKLQRAMPPGMEAALVTDGSNRFYLTGMRSSAGTVLVLREKAFLFIDFRYLEDAEKKVKNCVVVEEKELYSQLGEALARKGVKNLSVCAAQLSVQKRRQLAEGLPGVGLDDSDALSDLLEGLRSRKDDDEIAWHREAQRITDETFTHICGFIRPGRTELEIAQEIGTTLTRLGSDDRTFHFIVASGRNSTLPHGFATRKVVEPGDLVTMDFGANVSGRIADMTRTVAVGRVTDEQKKVYETVREAQRRALALIAPGQSCREVDAAARRYIYDRGYEGCFSHGLGHSVGVDVHENPRFNETCESLLEPGNILTVETGIYLKNTFGVRIEDMVVVTASGCENLTKSEKRLLVL